MIGPRDEDLDLGVEDDERHEAHFGFGLNRSHQIYDWPATDNEDDDMTASAVGNED